MLAIALVLEGRPRGEAAAQCGMDRQALRDWVHRYNAEGIAGLSDRPVRPAGPPRPEALPVAGAGGRGGTVGRGGAGPGRARRLCALAPPPSSRPHLTALRAAAARAPGGQAAADPESTPLNSSPHHISYSLFFFQK